MLQDISGNSYAGFNSTQYFYTLTDGTAPFIASLDPVDTATLVNKGTNITFTFNELMSKGVGKFTLVPSGGNCENQVLEILVGDPQVLALFIGLELMAVAGDS